MNKLTQHRIALSAFFFLSGINFASWTSRIPTLKELYNLNDAELGTILIAMPLSSFAGLPISSWLVSRFETRIPMLFALLSMCLALFSIGYVDSIVFFVLSICVFSFSMRIVNIAMNTQSINLQKLYKKKVVGSFHGLWSLGGLSGVTVSTLMIKLDMSLSAHMLIIAVCSVLVTLWVFRFLLKNDISTAGNKLILGKPDTFILFLGLLVFFAAVCEGGMFDWSGLYFKEVVKADVFTYGYLIFMGCMALSRFFSDVFVEKIGLKKTYVICAVLIAIGMLTAIVFPYFWTAMLGFCLVGFGTSAVIPMTFMLAGQSKKYSPGMAISIIATYGITGMFVGPPLIGYLSHSFGLQRAFLVFVIAGLMLIPISRSFFKRQDVEL
ncbi:MFS transporter [Galbibacter sp. EGI 63066]|uniref:MFS transporter n=1 Tax=Galbibacter sp. EGI 63066 TaxID=2993559 RepID=UPI002248A982|nr:MFS transporter [Galbibacter sp. EGI 63066]MCX2680477.1 MFS transporter [Galbibacter sp. EGI 63066]